MLQPSGVDMNTQLTDAYRRAEQLVVQVRALHVLSSSLQLAQQEVAAKRLQPSTAVREGTLQWLLCRSVAVEQLTKCHLGCSWKISSTQGL